MKAFQAYAKGDCVTRESARQAARDFFALFPRRRKCNVIEGDQDGRFFSITYGRQSEGKWPQSWKDVTIKTADSLPGLPS